MTFKENINRICRERNTTLTAVVKSLGLSTSKVSAWNDGALPKEEILVKLALRLGVSVMDFFADEDDLTPKDEDENEILGIFRQFDRTERHIFMAKIYEIENELLCKRP